MNTVATVTSASSTQTAGSSGSPLSGQTLGATQFLQLLTAEMQNQDPLKPVDDTQSVAQLAQFSSLSATEEMNQSFQNFQSNFGVMQAGSLIGHNVSVETANSNGTTSTVTGTVSGVVVQNGQPYFSMKDASGKIVTDSNGAPALYATNQIIGISS